MNQAKLLARPLELYVLITTFAFTVQFDRNLDFSDMEKGSSTQLLKNLHTFLEVATDPGHILGVILIICICIALIRSYQGKESRELNDSIAVYLSACWLAELLAMNLLLVSPLKEPTLLLAELLLFMPIVVIGFAWWYWRLNHSKGAQKKNPAISFSHEPIAIDYLFLSFGTLFKNNVTEHTFRSRTGKTIALFNTVVSLDIIGLTLSRAVRLVFS